MRYVRLVICTFLFCKPFATFWAVPCVIPLSLNAGWNIWSIASVISYSRGTREERLCGICPITPQGGFIKTNISFNCSSFCVSRIHRKIAHEWLSQGASFKISEVKSCFIVVCIVKFPKKVSLIVVLRQNIISIMITNPVRVKTWGRSFCVEELLCHCWWIKLSHHQNLPTLHFCIRLVWANIVGCFVEVIRKLPTSRIWRQKNCCVD